MALSRISSSSSPDTVSEGVVRSRLRLKSCSGVVASAGVLAHSRGTNEQPLTNMEVAQ
jgi:hypothetical protein